MFMSTRDIQQRLVELGFYSGPVDDRASSRTTRAIKAFQVANALASDGKVGPLTAAALAPDDTVETRDAVAAPSAPSVRTGPWPLQKDAQRFFGGVGLNQRSLELPFEMRLAWDRSVRVSRISVHDKVHDSAGRAFAAVARAYGEKARREIGLDIFGGSLNVRRLRGGSGYSMHAWGIAIDFDPERNQMQWGRDRARLAQADAEEFWRCWEAEGWVSLGRSRNFDWMHVQAARL
jgi:hypothetical protein